MSIFAQTSEGDFDISSGQLQVVDGQQMVLQLVRNYLRFFAGEEPLNPTLGVPYFQQLLAGETPQSEVETILRQYILDIPGVLDVLGFVLTVNTATRSGVINCGIQTATGIIPVTETFP